MEYAPRKVQGYGEKVQRYGEEYRDMGKKVQRYGEEYKQHLDSFRRKDSLRGAETIGAETTEISVRLENYFASHFEGSAESLLSDTFTMMWCAISVSLPRPLTIAVSPTR